MICYLRWSPNTLVLGALKIKLSLHSLALPPPPTLLHQPQCGYNSLFLGLSTIFRRWHVSFIALALDVVVAVDVLPNGHIRAFIVARIRLPWPMHKSVIECEPELESESDQERFQESQWKAKRERDIFGSGQAFRPYPFLITNIWNNSEWDLTLLKGCSTFISSDTSFIVFLKILNSRYHGKTKPLMSTLLGLTNKY